MLLYVHVFHYTPRNAINSIRVASFYLSLVWPQEHLDGMISPDQGCTSSEHDAEYDEYSGHSETGSQKNDLPDSAILFLIINCHSVLWAYPCVC